MSEHMHNPRIPVSYKLMMIFMVCISMMVIAKENFDKSGGPVKSFKSDIKFAKSFENSNILETDSPAIISMESNKNDKKKALIKLAQNTEIEDRTSIESTGRSHSSVHKLSPETINHLIKSPPPDMKKGITASKIFEPNTSSLQNLFKSPLSAENDDKKAGASEQTITNSLNPGWTALMEETFEGSFPSGNNWTIYYNSNSSEAGYGYAWDDASYRPNNGSWSGWCADGYYEGQPPISAPGPYPDYLNTWMVCGPFNLSDAIDAELHFNFWNISESGFDYFGYYASIDGSNFNGYHLSGDYGSWNFENFDLTNVPNLGDLCGESQVWIAFNFNSDVSITYEGAYVDDILLQADFPATSPNPIWVG